MISLFSLSLNPGRPRSLQKHTHSDTQIHTHTQTDTHVQTHTQTGTCSQKYKHASTHTNRYTHLQTHTQTGTHTCKHTQKQVHAHRYTNMQAHTQSDTHKHREKHTQGHTNTYPDRHTPTLTRVNTHSDTHPFTQPNAHINTHVHILTHALTQKHTHEQTHTRTATVKKGRNSDGHKLSGRHSSSRPPVWCSDCIVSDRSVRETTERPGSDSDGRADGQTAARLCFCAGMDIWCHTSWKTSPSWHHCHCKWLQPCTCASLFPESKHDERSDRTAGCGGQECRSCHFHQHFVKPAACDFNEELCVVSCVHFTFCLPLSRTCKSRVCFCMPVVDHLLCWHVQMFNL